MRRRYAGGSETGGRMPVVCSPLFLYMYIYISFQKRVGLRLEGKGEGKQLWRSYISFEDTIAGPYAWKVNGVEISTDASLHDPFITKHSRLLCQAWKVKRSEVTSSSATSQVIERRRDLFPSSESETVLRPAFSINGTRSSHPRTLPALAAKSGDCRSSSMHPYVQTGHHTLHYITVPKKSTAITPPEPPRLAAPRSALLIQHGGRDVPARSAL